MVTALWGSRFIDATADPAATLAVGNLGPVKALSKADRLRYHQHSPNGFHTLSGEIPAIRAIL